MTGELPGEMRIGEVLKQARARAGLEIRTVEDQTKIRVKYLRALEDEEWEALPSSAYAKGFLRTYAQLLGLDGEALADAYRRQVERGRSDPAYPLGDQVLERRRRPAAQPQRPRWLAVLAVVVLVVAAVLLAIGVLGGDGDEDGAQDGPGGARQEAGGQNRQQSEPAATGSVTLALAIREPVQICLVGGGGQALIDGQVLNAGDEEAYERNRFELGFPSGFDPDQFRLEVAGKQRRLPRAEGPAAYEIVAPQRVVASEPPGKECP